MTAAEKENPEALELRAKPRRVSRLNRKTIAVLVGVLTIAVLLAMMWGLRKPHTKSVDESTEKHNVERIARAEGLATLPRDYASIPKPPPLGAPVGEFGRPLLKAERDAGIPQLPEQPSFTPNPEEDALRAQRLKEQSEAEEAARASVFFQLKKAGAAHAPQSGSSRASPDLDTAPLAAVPARTAVGEGTASTQDAKHSFLEKDTDSRLYASATLQMPRSPYQLMAGSIIPAALVTGIKSDLPGPVIAVVTENVFDSVSGREVLIPQGAKLLGEYDSKVAYGQRRVLLVWTRLILPNGSSLTLDRLSGVDTEGYAGLEDGVDWHWRRLLAGAALTTLLNAGAEMAAPNQSDGSGTVIVATREGIEDSVNQVGQEITRRSLDIQPTLTNRPGLPLRVIVNKDLILRPYRS